MHHNIDSINKQSNRNQYDSSVDDDDDADDEDDVIEGAADDDLGRLVAVNQTGYAKFPFVRLIIPYLLAYLIHDVLLIKKISAPTACATQ